MMSWYDVCAGHYVVCFDPLDGSSNIDAGISTGSIFGESVRLGVPGVQRCRRQFLDENQFPKKAVANATQRHAEHLMLYTKRDLILTLTEMQKTVPMFPIDGPNQLRDLGLQLQGSTSQAMSATWKIGMILKNSLKIALSMSASQGPVS